MDVKFNELSKEELLKVIDKLETRLNRIELFIGLSPSVIAELDRTGMYK